MSASASADGCAAPLLAVAVLTPPAAMTTRPTINMSTAAVAATADPAKPATAFIVRPREPTHHGWSAPACAAGGVVSAFPCTNEGPIGGRRVTAGRPAIAARVLENCADGPSDSRGVVVPQFVELVHSTIDGSYGISRTVAKWWVVLMASSSRLRQGAHAIVVVVHLVKCRIHAPGTPGLQLARTVVDRAVRALLRPRSAVGRP